MDSMIVHGSLGVTIRNTNTNKLTIKEGLSIECAIGSLMSQFLGILGSFAIGRSKSTF